MPGGGSRATMKGAESPPTPLMQPPSPLILACSSAALFALAGILWWVRRRQAQLLDLPREWAVTARPVFNTDERRVYRQLRDALPHHIVLSKLPLVRFCQPTDPHAVRFWYDLLGSIHVTFAICSANGRVLAAIDLDTERGHPQRTLQIKHSVLGACNVRHMSCPLDHLPSIPELQLLVPQTAAASRAPPSPPIGPVAPRRRATLWHDSGLLQDSFFGPDNRTDSSLTSDFGGLRAGLGVQEAAAHAPAAPIAPDVGTPPQRP